MLDLNNGDEDDLYPESWWRSDDLAVAIILVVAIILILLGVIV